MYREIIYIPNDSDLKSFVLDELHKKPTTRNSTYQKLINLLIKYFYWPNMKLKTTEYFTQCLECQQVKASHQHWLVIIAFTHSRIEMGDNIHGFHHWFAKK